MAYKKLEVKRIITCTSLHTMNSELFRTDPETAAPRSFLFTAASQDESFYRKEH